MDDDAEVARLYFVRHGRSTHNESHEKRPLIWDAPLHKLGIRQASLLQKRFSNVPIDLCVSSPLTRALQTSLIALGQYSQLRPGIKVRTPHGDAVVEGVVPTVRLEGSGTRFDANDGEVNRSCNLGPGADVRLARRISLGACVDKEVVDAGAPVVVTNATVSVRYGEDSRAELSCLDTIPIGAAQDSRCPFVAWPEASEQLHESDDIGSSASDLRHRFPHINFEALPSDNSAWWYQDPDLPASADASACRECWRIHDYDETDDCFEDRIERLVKKLSDAVARGYRHIAVFAHCWVLEEIWRVRFGRKRRFSNAELRIARVLRSGTWEEDDSTMTEDSDSD